MLTVEVELLHGTYRGSADDTAMTGVDDDRGDWPPSPARLFSALVAADGTRERCHVTDGAELRFLETQPAPLIHADPGSDVTASPVRERFVVINESKPNTVQGYPARQSSVARPGTRRSPRHPHIAYVWPHAAPDEPTVEALRRRAARVGYLGCADSPVRVRVSTEAPGPAAPLDAWEPDPTGAAGLQVPFPGLVDVLDQAFDDFTTKGTVRRAWYRSEVAHYRAPGLVDPVHRVAGTTIWLRFERPLPGRRVLAMTETLRKAVFDLYQRHVLPNGGELPPVLTGHGFDRPNFRHAHWLALPDVGHRHARGRIHGAAIWLPDDTPADVIASVRTAVWHLRELAKPEVFRVAVRPHDGETMPRAASPARWQRPATRFASVFPVVHERFVRPQPAFDDVAAWCEHAGLPEPVAFQLRRASSVTGAVSLARSEIFRRTDPRRPFSHMELAFDRPVAGPVLLGAKRQFGLGLFVPLPDQRAGTGGEPDGEQGPVDHRDG